MIFDGITLSSVTNFLYQKASFVASKVAIYSAFIIESVMMGCLKLFQLVEPLLHKNIYPDVNLLSSRSDIKSESVYPSIRNSELPPKTKNKSFILLKYLRIFFTAVQYSSLGFY